MLKSEGFDLWADGYDRDVGLTEEADEYPFAGYKAVLGSIYAHISEGKGQSVLDLGCGTAALTARLYHQGLKVSAVDFSERMLEIAREKMPDAQLVRCSIEQAPDVFSDCKFDAIVSTYAMHHLTDEQKRQLVSRLGAMLTEKGYIYIGDVAFENEEKLRNCREQSGEEWDEDEIYFVLDQWADLPGFKVQFEIKSHCAGVLMIRPDADAE